MEKLKGCKKEKTIRLDYTERDCKRETERRSFNFLKSLRKSFACQTWGRNSMREKKRQRKAEKLTWRDSTKRGNKKALWLTAMPHTGLLTHPAARPRLLVRQAEMAAIFKEWGIVNGCSAPPRLQESWFVQRREQSWQFSRITSYINEYTIN